jgi:hypothetical protein
MSRPEKSRSKEWRIVHRAIGLLAAQAVQGRLETAGIPAVLDYDGTKLMVGIPTFAGTGEVRILVPLDRIAEARELLGADSEPDEDEEADE